MTREENNFTKLNNLNAFNVVNGITAYGPYQGPQPIIVQAIVDKTSLDSLICSEKNSELIYLEFGGKMRSKIAWEGCTWSRYSGPVQRFSFVRMKRKGLMVNTELYCSPLSALLRIAIRFVSQHPRTRASRTEHPFAAHARGRMRSAATRLDCSQVGAGMPPRAILLAQLKDWFCGIKSFLCVTRFTDTMIPSVCAPSNAHGITASKEQSWSSKRGSHNNRNLHHSLKLLRSSSSPILVTVSSRRRKLYQGKDSFRVTENDEAQHIYSAFFDSMTVSLLEPPVNLSTSGSPSWSPCSWMNMSSLLARLGSLARLKSMPTSEEGIEGRAVPCSRSCEVDLAILFLHPTLVHFPSLWSLKQPGAVSSQLPSPPSYHLT
ncbi:hypothetical protein C8J56DRAFT_897804 [Mycena floridula]|nr:hypothetical protein C8J56DRAFT_897804 [Mycena floridula]